MTDRLPPIVRAFFCTEQVCCEHGCRMGEPPVEAKEEEAKDGEDGLPLAAALLRIFVTLSADTALTVIAVGLPPLTRALKEGRSNHVWATMWLTLLHFVLQSAWPKDAQMCVFTHHMRLLLLLASFFLVNQPLAYLCMITTGLWWASVRVTLSKSRNIPCSSSL